VLSVCKLRDIITLNVSNSWQKQTRNRDKGGNSKIAKNRLTMVRFHLHSFVQCWSWKEPHESWCSIKFLRALKWSKSARLTLKLVFDWLYKYKNSVINNWKKKEVMWFCKCSAAKQSVSAYFWWLPSLGESVKCFVSQQKYNLLFWQYLPFLWQIPENGTWKIIHWTRWQSCALSALSLVMVIQTIGCDWWTLVRACFLRGAVCWLLIHRFLNHVSS